jgi:hypothetical protein
MDLKDFIATTLISIKEGIATANSKTDKAFKVMPEAKVVNFDIAVEIAKEKSSEKGGGLKIHVVEGKIGGSSTSKESNVSRINFTVGVNTIIT